MSTLTQSRARTIWTGCRRRLGLWKPNITVAMYTRKMNVPISEPGYPGAPMAPITVLDGISITASANAWSSGTASDNDVPEAGYWRR